MNSKSDFLFTNKIKNQSQITSENNQFMLRKNSDLNFELQAKNFDEENPYSPENFFSINRLQSCEPEGQMISLRCIPISKQDDQMKKEFNKSSYSKQRTSSQAYSTLMIYFNLKKFIQKLTDKVRQSRKLTDQQLQLIGDISSDKQILFSLKSSQFILNSQKKTFQNRFKRSSIINIMRLFQFQQQISQMKIEKSWKNRIKTSIKECFQNLIDQLQKNIEKIPLVEPDSTAKLVWDIITSVVRAYFIYWIPIEITYKPQFLFDDGVVLTVILVLTLVVDVLIRLNTVYYVAGQAIRARWEILTLQLKNTLLEDTLSYVPLMMYTITGYTRVTQMIQFIHLLFFYQFKYISKVFDQVEDQLNLLNKKYQYILSITKLISLLLYILHLFSCFQFFIAEFADYEQNWIKYRNLQNAFWFSQYTDSFYYSTVTMLTIGYGDIVPQSNPFHSQSQDDLEKLIAIFFMLLSCIWLSYCVNTVGTILQSISQNQNENKQKLFKINKYMEQRNISYQLQYKRVKQYLNYRWQQDTSEDITEQKVIIDQLSNELRDELFEETVSIMIHSCPLFLSNFSLQFKKQVIPFIQERIVEPDTVFNNFFDGINLLIIEQGQVEIYTGPTYKNMKQEINFNKASVLGKGHSMGVIEFLTDQVTKEQYRALGFLTLLSISKKDFLKVLQDFPSDYENYFQLRDSYLYQSHNPLQIKRQCYSCNSTQHDVISCPQIHLTVDREQVIKKYDFPSKQSRDSSFKRKTSKSDFSFKRDCNILQQYGEIFMEENQFLLKRQLGNQLEYQYSSDSENDQVKDSNHHHYYQRIKKDFHQKIKMKSGTFNMDHQENKKNLNLDVQSNESFQQFAIQSDPKIKILDDDQVNRTIEKDYVLSKQVSFDRELEQKEQKEQQHLIGRQSSRFLQNKNLLCPEPINKTDVKNQKFGYMQDEKLQKRIFQRERSRQNTRIFHRNYEQEIESFEVIYYKDRLKDFNDKQKLCIQQLYNKLLGEDSQMPLEIFILHKQLDNMDNWDKDFLNFEEQMKNFQKYKVEQNASQIIYQFQEQQQSGKLNDYKQFKSLIQYMMYPWQYISKYLRQRAEKKVTKNEISDRRKSNKSTIKIKLKKAIEIGKSQRLEKNKVYPHSMSKIKI